jgi:hypothetical protein
VQQLIGGWFEAWQAAERGRFVPWLPVFMGTGVLCYFALRAEPPYWLGITVALPAVGGVLLLRRCAAASCRVLPLWRWPPPPSGSRRRNSPRRVHCRKRCCRPMRRT